MKEWQRYNAGVIFSDAYASLINIFDFCLNGAENDTKNENDIQSRLSRWTAKFYAGFRDIQSGLQIKC